MDARATGPSGYVNQAPRELASEVNQPPRELDSEAVVGKSTRDYVSTPSIRHELASDT